MAGYFKRPHTYDFEISTMVNMFMNAISDIVVKRFNKNREPEDRIKSRLVYAPKQRVLADLLDKDQNLQLPVIACFIGGITRDPNRVYNKILGSYISSGTGGSVRNEQTPLPIDVKINVTVATRYQADMDQIISHLLPYVNPYFTMSWRTPGRPDFEIRSSVFWDGNVSISYPFDIAATQVAKVVADLSFTVKGWMFQSSTDETIDTIYTIHTTYNTESPGSQGGISPEYLLDIAAGTAASTDSSDYFRINGVPPQPKIIEPYYVALSALQQFNVFGAGFQVVNNVYVSGAPISYLHTTHNPFSAVPALSADYPAFNGAKINTAYWAYNKDNFVTFVMPSARQVGRVDVIIEGPVGYGKLTEYVPVNTFNPFVSGTPEYETFVPYQMPYLSGIQVRLK